MKERGAVVECGDCSAAAIRSMARGSLGVEVDNARHRGPDDTPGERPTCWSVRKGVTAMIRRTGTTRNRVGVTTKGPALVTDDRGARHHMGSGESGACAGNHPVRGTRTET